MVWVGRGLRDHLVPHPFMGRGAFHYSSFLKAPSNPVLGISRGAASPASVGNPFLYLNHPISIYQSDVFERFNDNWLVGAVMVEKTEKLSGIFI